MTDKRKILIHYVLKTSLTVVALLVFVGITACDHAETDSRRVSLAQYLPESSGINVLVISFDAFRYDRMGAYGSTLGLTPNMDQFAQDALVFENAYSASNATHPSFAAAFTARYPFDVFIGWELLNTQTLAEVFKAAGYVTGAFLANIQLSEERQFDQGFDVYHVINTRTDIQPVKMVNEFLAQHDQERFFAWVHFINPHSAYEYRSVSTEFYDESYSGKYQRSSGARIQTYDLSQMTDAQLDRIGALYNGEVHLADIRFGQVIEQVKELDLLDETLILVTADHGEAYREHNTLGHNQIYDEVVQIPLIIHHPAASGGGARVEVSVVNADYLPSLASIAGIGFDDEHLAGVNWLEPFNPERAILHTQMTNDTHLSMAMRKDEMKFIIWCVPHQDFGEEFYDLSVDPEELNNVIEQPKYAALADKMYEEWQRILDGNHPCNAIAAARSGVREGESLSEEARRQLRSLGYIQ